MSTYNRAAIAAGALFVLVAAGSTAAFAAPPKSDETVRAAAVQRANAFFGKLEFYDPAAVSEKANARPGAKPALYAGKPAAKVTKAAAIKGANSSLNALIAKYAAAEGVPVALAHAVIRVESNYRTNARGRAGEIGLMQIKPATARGMGFSGSAKALYDPATNLRWGMKYLGRAHELGRGDTCGTILRYNAGHGAKRMNKISAAYCGKVKRHLRRA